MVIFDMLPKSDDFVQQNSQNPAIKI